LLSHRERSRRELRTRLRAKGFDPETTEAVLDRLAESDLQSDDRFAAEFVSSAQRSRGLATFAIQGELRRRGIDQGLAAEAATESPEAEEERARAIARRRASALRTLPPEVRHRRVAAYLGRRGYPSQLCERLAAEESGFMDEDQSPPGSPE
jgi:regulatory protein